MTHPSFPFLPLLSLLGPYHFFWNPFLTQMATCLLDHLKFILHTWKTHLTIPLSCLLFHDHLLPRDPDYQLHFLPLLFGLIFYMYHADSCPCILTSVIVSAGNVFPILIHLDFFHSAFKINYHFLQEASPDFMQLDQIRLFSHDTVYTTFL